MSTRYSAIEKFLSKYRKSLKSKITNTRMLSETLESLDKFFTRFPEKKVPLDFSIVDIQDYRQLRQSEGYADSTISKELSAVRGFFNWLNLEEHLELPNPVVDLRESKGNFKTLELKILTLDEILQALTGCKNNREKLIIWMGLLLGTSSTALQKLEWKDFNPGFSEFYISENTPPIPVPEDLTACLKDIDIPFLIRVRKDEFLCPFDILNKWRTIAFRAGIVPYPAYESFRITLLYYLIRLGASVKNTSRILGEDFPGLLVKLNKISPKFDLNTARKFQEWLRPVLDQDLDHSFLDGLAHIAEVQPPQTLPQLNDADHSLDQVSAPQPIGLDA